VSAEFDDWHFNVRQSNTEPLLRLNLEGLTPEIMEKHRDEVLAIIRSWSQLSSLRNNVRRRFVKAPEGAAR
jgi:phosphomannomutase